MGESQAAKPRCVILDIWGVLVAVLLGLNGCVSPPSPPPTPGSAPTVEATRPTIAPVVQVEPTPGVTPHATASLGNTPGAPAKATFTGQSEDHGYDADENGLYEHLRVDVEVAVETPGSFGFTASLMAPGGDMLALGSLSPDLLLSAPVISTRLETGTQMVSLYFNGRALRDSGVDGPYPVQVGLHDETGNLLDTAELTTQPHSSQAFQGLLFEVQEIGDSAVELDATPGHDLLRVSVTLNALAAGDAAVQGQLFAGDVFLDDVSEMRTLDAGLTTLNLDFPADAIAASGQDGPYTVYLTVSDHYYTDNQVYTTAAYDHQQFR